MGAFTSFKSSVGGENIDILDIPRTFLEDPFAKFSSQTSFRSDSVSDTRLMVSHPSIPKKSTQVSLEDIVHVTNCTYKPKSTINRLETLKLNSWEERHSLAPTSENPFLTELGSLSVHALVSAFKARYRQSPCIKIFPEIPIDSITPETLIFQRSSFIRDFLLVHLGVISSRFFWHQEGESLLDGSFKWLTDALDTVVFDITHGCLASLLEFHLHAATAVRRLDWLASRPLLGYDADEVNGYHGKVWNALRQGLSEWLRVYAVTLERTVFGRQRHRCTGLLELSQCLQPLMTNVLAVAHAFGVSPISGSDRAGGIQVQSLSGLRLLAWIGRQVITSTPNTSRSLEFIFHRAATPFIQFLHLWTQEGIIKDPHKEFPISLNNRFLHRRDANFWRHAVDRQSLEESEAEHLTLRPDSNYQETTLFGLVPASAEADILRCGLSILLLRSIAPNANVDGHANHRMCANGSRIRVI
ncbi:hypothetical protein Aperf_G00000074516 [Anoplocephala perfoliata]